MTKKAFKRLTLFTISTSVFLLSFLSLPTLAASPTPKATVKATPKATPKVDPWTFKRKIIYVGLTPSNDPDFWLGVQVDPETAGSFTTNKEEVKANVSAAIKFWKKASNNKMKFVTPQFFFGKAGTAISHCASQADLKVAIKIAGIKAVTKETHLIVVNTNSTCGWAGLGAQSGNTINLNVLGHLTLIHELGHNFGFLHSSSIYCKDNNYDLFNARNCKIGEYDDSRDVMGNDADCPESTLSATQRATVFFIPPAKDLKLDQTYTVDESHEDSINLVYQIKVNGNWYFFEYLIPTRTDCLLLMPQSRTPEIQVRMIGPDWTTKKELSIGTILITRIGKEPAPITPPTDVLVGADPDVEIEIDGFKAGEKFKLPGTSYYLHVISTGTRSAEFKVTKN